jgi:hypothetical protein
MDELVSGKLADKQAACVSALQIQLQRAYACSRHRSHAAAPHTRTYKDILRLRTRTHSVYTIDSCVRENLKEIDLLVAHQGSPASWASLRFCQPQQSPPRTRDCWGPWAGLGQSCRALMVRALALLFARGANQRAVQEVWEDAVAAAVVVAAGTACCCCLGS